ncbi:efflux RND transporter periplasmic adaptor subunit [Paenibacillus sp. S150]|uniref:efflux RND transporter periplasmic adaptor subunit n=1 Tax=Paenibacillus sp. S150 TaxID=2749826 RepID=UPI001C5621B7|nr:efflux RND transporter periplasmic adaptor subunit [Paenibacillus sp. S150]MBW4080785.1 efflux RND transporter periplasmic adaptor subunit [Paenibacillus sp. S150]
MKRIIKKAVKWVIIAGIVAAAAFILYTKVFTGGEPEVAMEPPQVISFPVTQESMTSSVQVKGRSQYQEETLVYAPFASRVTAWKAENGGQVTKGDILFTLDQSALKNEIATAEATIRKAKLEAELNAFLSQQEDEAAVPAGTEAERLKALAARESARLNDELNEVNAKIQEQELSDKRAKLNSAVYHAPATGIFLYDSSSESGERPQMVADNQYIGKIVDLGKLEFIALVGEQDIFRIKQGMKVQVKMTAVKDLILAGEVTEVSKFATTTAGQNTAGQVPQFEVVISLQPDEHLIGGLSLSGEIETLRKDNATVVSSIAVIHEGDQAFVMLDKGNGQYERTEIKIGMETSEKTEVLSGLKPGDTVVLQ